MLTGAEGADAPGPRRARPPGGIPATESLPSFLPTCDRVFSAEQSSSLGVSPRPPWPLLYDRSLPPHHQASPSPAPATEAAGTPCHAAT